MALPFDNQLSEIADSMGISLYQRFSLSEASVFLHCQIKDVEKLIAQGKIDYIQVTDTQIDFFGFQLLQHLLGSVTGSLSPPSAQQLPDRIIRSKEVQNKTGLSRTTIWRLERKGEFPARIPLSAGSVGWRLGEVEEWIKSR